VRQGHVVFPINPNALEIEGLPAYASVSALPDGRIDRVLLYVPPEVGVQVLDELVGRDVGEVWVNPGAESEELFQKAQALGLTTVYACSIVDIGENPAAP